MSTGPVIFVALASFSLGALTQGAVRIKLYEKLLRTVTVQRDTIKQLNEAVALDRQTREIQENTILLQQQRIDLYEKQLQDR